MSVKVVIPARFGSSRLPGKPLIDLAGLPMIVRVYRRVSAALPGCHCLVAVDDERISKVLIEYGIPWVMTRSDHESGTDRIAEVCTNAGWQAEDIVINVQGDEPLMPPSMLHAFADFIQAIPEFQMGTISAPIDEIEILDDPNVVKVVTDKFANALYFSRYSIPFCRDGVIHETALKQYQRHIGIYAYRVDCLLEIASTPPVNFELSEKLEQLRALWLGITIAVMHWTQLPPHGVDTPEDVLKVIAHLEKSDG